MSSDHSSENEGPPKGSLMAPAPHLMSDIPATSLARLARAITHWQSLGATWVSLPWWAPSEFVQGTRPIEATGQDTTTPHGQLVASGEQAFCWLGATSRLPEGLCIGWTPCFRDEPVFDQHHHFGFLKAELFQWVPAHTPANLDQVAHRCVSQMIGQACALFNTWLDLDASAHPQAVIIATHEGFDINCQGVELGSYGWRLCPETKRPYVYGTALAEPRFGEVLALLKHIPTS